jgi:hypothetical protein
MKCSVWHSLQYGELQPVTIPHKAQLFGVKKCLMFCRNMTNKSLTNKVYYLFIKSYYQHDITVTCSNDAKVRRYNDTGGTALYGSATRPTKMWNFYQINF